MLKVFFTSLILILSSTVMAQAAPLQGGLFKKLETNNWTALYAGTTELDGLAVLAALENTEDSFNIQSPMVLAGESFVPFTPMKQMSFRLSLVVQDQPSIKVSFPLQARTLNIDGYATVAYQSVPRLGDQFEFLVSPRKDGTLLVQYRRLSAENSSLGEFALSPIPQLMGK